MNERPIPPAALTDSNSVEMIRIWIAGKQLHTSIKLGMYREASKLSEEKAWGRILADVVRHIGDAFEQEYGVDRNVTIGAIASAFSSQLEDPETNVSGRFHQQH